MRSNLRIIALIICITLIVGCLSPPTTLPTPFRQPPVAGLPHAQLEIYPEDTADGLVARIAAARQRVFLTIYLITDQRFIGALKSARNNGATVRVLIEQHPVGNTTSGPVVLNELRTSGIDAKFANPAFRLTHQKSIIIDNSAVIMTANLTSSGFKFNREFSITSDDVDLVKEIVDVFNADWSRDSCPISNANLVWSPVNSRVKIGVFISATQRSLDIYAEEVQDDEQTQALVNTAKSGSKVRLLISPPIDNAAEDSNARDLDKLQRGGVLVRYLSKPYIHAKVFVVDGAWSFIGSQNISANSLEFNRELGVIVSDMSVIRRISDRFSKDWNSAIER